MRRGARTHDAEQAKSKQKAVDVGHFGRDEAAATMQFFAEMAVAREIFRKIGVVR
jgi:hypothetical protein